MNSSSTLDEKTKRRDGFDPDSVPIEWPGVGTLFIPKPRLLYRRSRNEDGKTVARQSSAFGSDYDALVEAVGSATKDQDFIASLFDLAADLLRRNYDLSEDELDAILVFPRVASPDGELPPPWDDLWRVASGLGPKSREAGSPPAS